MRQSAPDLEWDTVVSQQGIVDLNVGSRMIVTDASQARILPSTDYNVAVIRVSDRYNHSPDITAAQISDSVFGTSGDPLNLVRDIFPTYHSHNDLFF